VSKDPWEGSYTRPLLQNPWLYAEGNPVNYIDPSGLDAIEGMLIHTMIEDHYIANYGSGRIIVKNYLIPGASKSGSGYRGFADIADLTRKEIYEIKSIESDLQGEMELYWYLAHLPADWGPGTIYPYHNIYIGPWPNNPNREVHAAMHILGVIAYWGEDKRPDIRLIPVPLPIPEKKRAEQQNYGPGWRPVPAYVQCSIDPTTGALVIGGTLTIGTIIWWLSKLLSPGCGPLAPLCAAAF